MQFMDRKKSGTVTVEVTLSILSILLVLFVALGMFSDNLGKMATNGNLKNITTENSAKTSYTNYNRDYSESTIFVK